MYFAIRSEHDPRYGAPSDIIVSIGTRASMISDIILVVLFSSGSVSLGEQVHTVPRI